MDKKIEAQQAWISKAAQLPSDNEGLAYLKGIDHFKASLKEDIELSLSSNPYPKDEPIIKDFCVPYN
jgi:hypothetical protein